MSAETGKKWKIAHVITRMIVGGAQENTFLSVRFQCRAGHDAVLVTGPTTGREGKLLEAWRATPIPVVEMPELVREISIVRDLAAFWKLYRFFRREKFDVVHTHSAKAGILGRLAAFCAGVPVVVHTVHGPPWSPEDSAFKKRFYVFSERLAARVSRRIYAVAQAMIDRYVALKIAPRDRFRVVYSGMNVENFLSARRDEALRRKLGIPEGAFVIVTLARLFPLKGYEFVPEAFARFAQHHPEAFLLILGDGPMREAVSGKLKSLGVGDKVRFAGLVAPDKVPPFLAQGDLLWHLSLREGLPRSVVQALATGIPAVGFALDGTPEAIRDGETGFCVEPRSIDAVVAATEKIFADPGKRREMGTTGRRFAARCFDVREMARFLEEDYGRLLSEKRS